MIILHIASFSNRMDSGVSVVVPKYLSNEQKINKNTYLINIDNNAANYNNDKYIKETRVKKVQRIIKHLNPDIIVFHEVYYPKYIAISNYVIKNKIPYIIIPHGCLTSGAQNIKKYKKKMGNIFFKKYLKKANAIHYLSEFEKKDSVYALSGYVLGNGIDIPRKTNRNKNNKNIIISYIGRIDIYHKGIDLLLEAVNISQNVIRSKRVTINIYGTCDNSTKKCIKHYINSKQIDDIVFLKKPVYGAEKRKVLERSHYFIQTSRFEGHPMGIIEAMSFGVPVLATYGTGMGDEISKNNLGLSCKTDAVSISKSLEKMLTLDNVEEQSHNARRFAMLNYDWSVIAKNNIKVYAKTKEIVV